MTSRVYACSSKGLHSVLCLVNDNLNVIRQIFEQDIQ